MKANKGFTLAEMLIALVLVGVIASMVVPKLLLSTGDKQLVSKLQTTAASIEQLISLRDPNSTANWVNYLAAGLNGKVTAAGSALTIANSGCAAGNAVADKSTYVTLKDGTVVAIGTSAALAAAAGDAVQGELTATGSGNIAICIDPAPAANSARYFGMASITNGAGKVDWGSSGLVTTSSTNVKHLIGTVDTWVPGNAPAAALVNTVAKSL